MSEQKFMKAGEAPRRQKEEGWWETIKVIVQALLIALVVRTLLFQPFNIPSGSMIPTLLIGDYLFVSKYAYGYSHYSLPGFLDLAPAAMPGRLFARRPSAATSWCSGRPATPTRISSSGSSACPATRCR